MLFEDLIRDPWLGARPLKLPGYLDFKGNFERELSL